MNTSVSHSLKVFLCHSSLDKPTVRELYQLLIDDGFDVWFDEESLVAGQDWESKIEEILEEVDIVIICLSNNSVNATGFAQKEIRIAIEIAQKQPDGKIFLIPTRLDECPVPRKLRSLHWVDYFQADGYSKLRKSLHLQARKSGLQIRPLRVRNLPMEVVDFKRYPWQSFGSFRYLESLDSTRFGQSIREPEIKLLSCKSELLESLLFGDGIALSEPQLVDSRGAVEALSELVKSAQESNVRIPIRIASRQPNLSVFGLASYLVGMIDETQLSRRYIISANPSLDMDISRRQEWSKYLSQGIKGFDGLIGSSLPTESEFAANLFAVLNYVDHDSKMVIGAKREEERFSRELEQILSLTIGDLLEMCRQKPDPAIPDIMHPQWFASEDEANAASEVISGLQMIINTIGGIPKVRSPIYDELMKFEKANPRLAEGIKEIVDSVYNHVVGIAVRADSLSDTTSGDTQNILVKAGHVVSQWARQLEKRAEGQFSYELPWAWGAASQMSWSKSLEADKIKQIAKFVPWSAILTATQEPEWKESLANYRTALGTLQVIDSEAIRLETMGKRWWQRHEDGHKRLNEAWQSHIELSTRLISNQYWKLSLDGIRYFNPEVSAQPLPATKNYRTMGTVPDFPSEMDAFRTMSQRGEFERNIFGVVNEMAQKKEN